MADQFLGEIRIFPFNFPPKGWTFCEGQLMPISQNTALFSLLGTTYGGDGKVSFALPNLQGSAPMHPGQGPGLSLHSLGESGGSSNITLLESEIPSHSHSFNVSDKVSESSEPMANSLAVADFGVYNSNTNSLKQLNEASLTPVGGSLPHNNMMPYLAFNFCIAVHGIYPQRP